MRKNLIKNSAIDIFTGKIPGKHKKASKIKTLKSLKFQRLLVLDRGVEPLIQPLNQVK